MLGYPQPVQIAVVGTGYVGLITGVVLADMGNHVICVDKDQSKLEMLRRGESPIYEPGIEPLLARTLHSGRLTFTDSIAEATENSEVIFIAVGTPPAEDGTPDMTAVRAVTAEIAKGIKKKILVVNKSTMPVGSGDMVTNMILDAGVPRDLFDVVSNPEFLREGSAIYDTLNPTRIVIGAKNPEAAQVLVELYKGLEAPVLITDPQSAELIKYGANSFLATKISFINAMSRLAEAAGANISDIAKGIGLDNRIGPQFLQAGLGWGGSCLPKDVRGLITTGEKLGYRFGLLEEVEEINRTQSLHFVDRIRKRLGGFSGKKIGLLGLAFKPNTDDIRDAKSLIIIRELLAEGATVSAFDPVAAENVKKVYPELEYCNSAEEVAKDVDCLVLVTEWDEFRQLNLHDLRSLVKQPIFFDGRRCYSKTKAEQAGFEYTTIGS